MKRLASAGVFTIGLAALLAPRVAVAATHYEVVAEFFVNEAFDVAVDPSLHRVYSPNGTLLVVDGNSDSIIAQLPAGGGAFSVAVDPTTHAVFVGDQASNAVFVYDGASFDLIATVPLEDAPGEIAVDPSTHTVYVLGTQSLTVIDGVANAVTDVRAMEGEFVCVDPTTHTVYVTDYFASALLIIDGSTHNVVDAVPVASPRGADVDPALHTVFVSTEGEDIVSLVDTRTHAVFATVPVGMSVYAVAVDPVSHAVYLTSGTRVGGDAIRVLDGNTKGVVATFPDLGGPAGVAVDSVTHTAFVSNIEGDLEKILAVCEDPVCLSSTVLRFGALVANGHGIHGLGLALPLLVAGISESIGYQVGACRAMRLFTAEVEVADAPFLTDVLATDWINQAEAIESAMDCP